MQISLCSAEFTQLILPIVNKLSAYDCSVEAEGEEV